MSTIPSAGRALIAAVLVLSACTPDEPAGTTEPDAGAADTATSAEAGASGTKAERAAAAGLSDEQVAYLDSTEVPVYLPVLPEGWRLEDAFTERDDENDTFVHFYSVTYRTPDSTCVSISGSEGAGEPWSDVPPNERDVTVSGVPTDGPVRLGWGVAGGEDAGWEGGLVATEAFGTDGHSYVVGSSNEDGCQVASPEDVETFLASLRALDPDMDVAPN